MNENETNKIKILHVDDDNLALELTKMYLERMSPEVELVPFTSGTSALHSFKEEKFDCVLSDFHMPVLDGLALMRRMREIEPQIPFMLLSGDDREDIAVTALLSGVDEYFVKGMRSKDYAEILERIHQHLKPSSNECVCGGDLKERLQKMLEQFASAAYIVSTDGRIVYNNQVFVQRYGDSLEQKCHEAVMGTDEYCSTCIMGGNNFDKAPRFSECTTKNGRDVRLFSHPIQSLGNQYVLHMILNGAM